MSLKTCYFCGTQYNSIVIMQAPICRSCFWEGKTYSDIKAIEKELG